MKFTDVLWIHILAINALVGINDAFSEQAKNDSGVVVVGGTIAVENTQVSNLTVTTEAGINTSFHNVNGDGNVATHGNVLLSNSEKNIETLKADTSNINGLEKLGFFRARISEINAQLSGSPTPNDVPSLNNEKKDLEKQIRKITQKEVNQQYISHDVKEMQIQGDYIGEKVARVFKRIN